MTSEKDIKAEDVLEGLIESLEQSVASEQAGNSLPRSRKIERRVVDIPTLRERYGMTQQQFADAFRISIGTLRGWEQGRRTPDGPARRLLEVIEDQPEIAQGFFGDLAVIPESHLRATSNPTVTVEHSNQVARLNTHALYTSPFFYFEPGSDVVSHCENMFFEEVLSEAVIAPDDDHNLGMLKSRYCLSIARFFHFLDAFAIDDKKISKLLRNHNANLVMQIKQGGKHTGMLRKSIFKEISIAEQVELFREFQRPAFRTSNLSSLLLPWMSRTTALNVIETLRYTGFLHHRGRMRAHEFNGYIITSDGRLQQIYSRYLDNLRTWLQGVEKFSIAGVS